MSGGSPLAAALVRDVLADDGKVSWMGLIGAVLSNDEQRELCRKHGLSPKGGFRLEKAPAKVLSPLLADSRVPELIEELAVAVSDRLRSVSESGPPEPEEKAAPSDPELEQRLARMEQALHLAQSERDRARESAAGHLERAEGADQRRAVADELVVRLRSQVAGLERRLADRPVTELEPDRELVARVHELERDIDSVTDAEAALRRQLALARTQERELTEQLAELEELIPKGRRKRRRVEEPPAPPKRCFLPYLLPTFYKSLEGRERKSVERAIQAVLLYCTEGPSYPGLEVKQLGGQDLWSMRASRKLRIYFRTRSDGDIDVLELGDREDQPTTLRRLKERD